MPSTEPVEPISKLACPSADELRQYLGGWIDGSQAAEIDAHLQSCGLCDRSLKELESHPETLLQSLQSTVGHSGVMQDPVEQQPIDEDCAQAGKDSVDPITAALEKVKRLIDVPRMPADDKAKAAWQPALKELGIYDLIRPLGRGGMGAVYLAVHRQLRKQVAIKLLPLMSGEDSGLRARFEREIRVVGKLNHPSIVAATDAGEIDGTQFLVMEYVPGRDLSRLARLMGRLSVADSCELIRQVALGLSCAHAEGVVHRDVKPSNLMLDESGRIRILDFGLAQLSVWDEASVDLTTVGQLMGTLDYMAPEQAELSGNVDYRADLYALGATLFRLLCGRPPLAAAPNQSPLEKLRLLANHQPPKLNTLCPEAPLELVNLVSSMLARNPSDRPASAAHVAEQLAPIAAGSRLVELLENAKQKAASMPEPSKQPLVGDIPAFLPNAPSAFAHSAFDLPAADRNNGRNKIIRRLFIAALIPLVIIAGMLIKLETSKGQLVIESDVDNITVKLVKNGKPLDVLQISHGTTSTRLQADNYEITIEGPSDGLEIINNQFTLKSGETIVAKIRRVDAATEPSSQMPVQSRLSPSEISAPLDPIETMRFKLYELDVERQLLETRLGTNHPQVLELKQEIEIRHAHLRELTAERDIARDNSQTETPLYDGKPLEHWLDMLGREKSAVGLASAFDACTALVTDENGEQIANVVLKVVPRLNGEMNLEADPTKGSSTVDRVALPLLRAALPGPKFFSRWVAEFEIGDLAWRARLWKSYMNGSTASSVEDVEPFVAWVEQKLRQDVRDGNDTDPDCRQAADQLRNMIATYSELSTEACRNRVMRILTSSTQLPISWWLSQPLIYRTGENDREIWPSEFKVEVTRRAIEAMLKEETPPKLVVQASIILANNNDVTAEQQRPISEAINRRLEALAIDRSSLTQMVRTSPEFTDFSVPVLDNQSPLHLALLQIQISVQHDSALEDLGIEHSVVLTLLNHAWKLDKGASTQAQLDQIFRSTHGTFERIQAQAVASAAPKSGGGSDARGFGRGATRQILLHWPDLKTTDRRSQDPFSRDSTYSIVPLWGNYVPTKEDWLEYLILLHPVMTERVTQAVKEFAPTPAAEAAPAEKTE